MKILYDPAQAILDAKKHRSLVKSIGVLLISTLLFIATIVVSCYFMKIPLDKIIYFEYMEIKTSIILWAFLIIFLGGMFFGFILTVVMNTLGGNGSFFDGLTAVSYFLLPLSIGIFISFAINFAPLQITDVNLMLLKSLIIFAIGIFFTAESVAIMYRAIKELFETGMVDAWVGVIVVSVAIIIPVYILLYSFVFQTILGLSGSMLGGITPFKL